MARLRLTKIDEYQFLTCLKHSLWGSKTNRFKDWREGDYLAFKVDKYLAGLAIVNGRPFKSEAEIWEDHIYPHRIPIKFLMIVEKDKRPQFLGKLRDALINEWGTG